MQRILGLHPPNMESKELFRNSVKPHLGSININHIESWLSNYYPTMQLLSIPQQFTHLLLKDVSLTSGHSFLSYNDRYYRLFQLLILDLGAIRGTYKYSIKLAVLQPFHKVSQDTLIGKLDFLVPQLSTLPFLCDKLTEINLLNVQHYCDNQCGIQITPAGSRKE